MSKWSKFWDWLPFHKITSPSLQLPLEPQQLQRKKECAVMPKLSKFWIGSPFCRVASVSLQLFLEDKETADVTFTLENNRNGEIDRIPAHKCILAPKSTVFDQQLKNTTNTNTEIQISGIYRCI